MNRTPLAAQAHWLDRQVLDTPGERTIKERIEREVPTLHGPFHPVPTPAQMRDVRQCSACEAPLMVDELAGEHSDKHYGDEVSGARGQTTNQVVQGTSSQVNWLRGQTKRCTGWFRHPPSISEFWPLLLLIW